MTKSIKDIEGIGPSTGEVLRDAGINSVDDLLDAACDKNGRARLADKTNISEVRILKWVNMADLFRINGVAGQYAELLENAGVDTVKELKNRNAENLVKKMNAVNDEKSVCRRPPSVKVVSAWIEQAKRLTPKITH